MKGEIGTFSVAEILQMIGMQEKSGLLSIKSKGKSAVLFFDTGKVLSARDRRQGSRDPFLFYLQEKGAIGVEDLNRITEIRQDASGDLVDILLSHKIVDEKKLGKLLGTYAAYTLETVVKWESGTYEFAPSVDSLPEKAIVTPQRLEAILMEALRRKDEVEEIRRFLPGYDTRIKVAVSDITELPLEEADAGVLMLVNGKRTIDEIIDDSDTDEIDTLDILERLFALGIVSISEADHEGPGHLLKRSALQSLITAVAIVTVAALLRFIWLVPGAPDEQPIRQLRNTIQEVTDQREVQNLHFALDAYHYLHRRYPGQLTELVTMGLLTEEQITSRYGSPYAYRYFPTEERYVLSP
ncbi:MAG: DUF4388 domain-containing protein [Candidatus Eisenbacteria bacterium]